MHDYVFILYCLSLLSKSRFSSAVATSSATATATAALALTAHSIKHGQDSTINGSQQTHAAGIPTKVIRKKVRVQLTCGFRFISIEGRAGKQPSVGVR
jgi:hypothetical protein